MLHEGIKTIQNGFFVFF